MIGLPRQFLRAPMAFAGLTVVCVTLAAAQDAGAAMSQSQDQTTAQQGQRTDAQIEMDVVHALDASAPLKNDLITAATIQGEVTLSGTVSIQSSKQLAESIVAHVNGVTKVHNNLTVGTPGPDAQALQPAPDTENIPDADQSQAQQGMAGLPPPGPAPNQNPNEGQAPGVPPNASQGGYPAYPPPQRPEYQSPYPQQYPQQQYPQQQYPQQQYPQQPQYSQQPQYPPAPPEPRYAPATGPVTLQPGTMLQLRTSEPVGSKHAQDGQPVEFMVIQDVTMGGVLAIPRGAAVHGVVTESNNVGSGQMSGRSTLALTLTSLDLGGRNYSLHSDEFRVKSPNKAGRTVGSAITGGLIGTIIGCAVGRGPGCAIGAGAGALAGTAASTASSGPGAWIPAEALVTFHLAASLTVDPVSPQEAARLAQGLYRGGPNLYRRGPMGSPYYGYGYAPSYYPYPAPYYVPYYMVGGVYYWR